MSIILKKNECNINHNFSKIFISLFFLLIFTFFGNKNCFKIIKIILNVIPNNTFDIKKKFIYKVNKTVILINGKKYIDKCLNQYEFERYIDITENPIISSIIPVFNSEATIHYAICSIQRQNFSLFEIILIDDYSKDNSTKIIKNLQKHDKRIKLIKNKRNMGSLYSRCIGVFFSRGQFIFPLDNDDMFFNYDIFFFILKFANEFKFDIVGFRAFKIHNYSDQIDKIEDLYNYSYYPDSIIINQPQLSTWMINNNGKFQLHDLTIWAKCIKAELYKNAIINLGIKRYSFFVSWAEDAIINFIIFNLAKSFIFLKKYGIIHFDNISTASYRIPYDIKLFGDLFFVDIIYDFSKNNSDKNYAVLAAYFVKRKIRKIHFVNNTNLIYFKYILNKLLKSQYISNQFKTQLKIDFKPFLF